ncbi:LysR family transcriptional regulator [Sutterella sp.]|uniref:LysR family transcriptional regulator n=1 Tax=Sutterella sp. TaxID=1981025 RepID=UPI0026DFD3D0|nr:LysR family transcriptional regulator [Sutterella sp.]MDO5532382.1 LysR family transcriptional regulator [Sutterella sp.]
MTRKIQTALLSKNPQIFMMCCDLRNFSEVAKALGMTQSAVSKAILAMEAEVGFELFDRSRRPLVLTPEAKVLHTYLREVTGEFSKILSEVRSNNSIRPVLRLGILESLSTTVGVEIVRRLSPTLSQILLITASANVLMQRLIERKLDVIISNDISMESQQIYRTKLMEEPSILVLPRALAATKPVWTWEDLRFCGLPLISYWNESGAGKLNDLFLRSNGFNFPEHLVVDTNSLMLKLVAEGMGWAFTRPTSILQNITMLPELGVVEMQKPVLTREVFIMGRRGEFISEAEVIRDISSDFIRSCTIPEIEKFAPWVAGKFRVLDR